jgi:hypothetical protein
MLRVCDKPRPYKGGGGIGYRADMGRSGAAPVHELGERVEVGRAGSKPRDLGNDRGYRVARAELWRKFSFGDGG